MLLKTIAVMDRSAARSEIVAEGVSDEKSAAFLEISGDTYGDTLFRNPVQLSARQCRSKYLFNYNIANSLCS